MKNLRKVSYSLYSKIDDGLPLTGTVTTATAYYNGNPYRYGANGLPQLLPAETPASGVCVSNASGGNTYNLLYPDVVACPLRFRMQ